MLFGISKKLILPILLLSALTACGQKAPQKSYEERERIAAPLIAQAVKLQEEGRNAEALPVQLKIVEMLPEDAGKLVVLAGIYMRLNELDKAKETAEQSLKLIPDDKVALEVYAQILMERREYGEAAKVRKRIVDKGTASLQQMVNLGVAYELSNQIDLARESYKKALLEKSDYIYALYRLSLLELDFGDKELGMNLLRKIAETKTFPKEDTSFIEEAKQRIKKSDNK